MGLRDNILAACAALLLAGCQNPGPRFDPRPPAGAAVLQPFVLTNQVNQINPEWLKPPTNLFTLGPGDKLEIELLSDPTSKKITTVGPDGKIYFNLLSGLDVWGLTLAQTKASIEQEMAKFIRDRIQVTV